MWTPGTGVAQESDLGDLLFTDWSQFVLVAQDGTIDFSLPASELNPDVPACNSSSGACLTLTLFQAFYSTVTDETNVSAQGSFTGLSVAGVQTSGTFGITFRPHPLSDFIINATPGAFAISTRDLGNSRFLTIDAEDDFQARDSSNNRIVDDIAVTVEHRITQSTESNDTVLSSHAHVTLLGTNASNEIVKGAEIIVAMGRPTVAEDARHIIFSEQVLRQAIARKTPPHRYQLKFRKINNVPVSLVLNPDDTASRRGSLHRHGRPRLRNVKHGFLFFSHTAFSLLTSKTLGTKATATTSSYSCASSVRKVRKSSSSNPLSSMLALIVMVI